jgi:tellurite resistance protein
MTTTTMFRATGGNADARLIAVTPCAVASADGSPLI